MNEQTRIEIERYLAGGMTPDETQVFLAGIRDDREALAALGRALEDEAHLYDALRTARESETRPSRDTSRILKARRLTGRHRVENGPAAGWLVGGLAAAAAILLIVASTGVRPKPAPKSPVARVVEMPVERAPEAPRREATPVPPPPAPAPVRVEPPAPRPLPEAPLPPPAPEPAPRPKPAPTEVLPPEPPKKVAPAIAKIEQAAAGLVVVDAGVRLEARAGQALLSGQGLESAAGGVLRFPDGTRLELAADTVLREVLDDSAGGKRVTLLQGALVGEISKQPTGKPMLFSTPHATAKVLGTTLRLSIEGNATRLEVREGKVQLKRTSDGKAVDVVGGSFALAADGSELAARPSPIDEILLAAPQGEIGGTEWKLIRDPDARTGFAFEALRTSNRQPFTQTADSSRISFVFRVDANRDYYVWVRGCAQAKVDPIKHDAVVVEFPDARVTEREGPSKGLAGNAERALFNGYMHQSGYWWVGGDADGANDEQPVVVRFARGGPQLLRLYASETPIRIDAIWISATQKTRPAPQGSPGR